MLLANLAATPREGVNDFLAKESRLAPARSLEATPLLQGEDKDDDFPLDDEEESREETAPKGVRAGATEPPHEERASSFAADEGEAKGRVVLGMDNDEMGDDAEDAACFFNVAYCRYSDCEK